VAGVGRIDVAATAAGAAALLLVLVDVACAGLLWFQRRLNRSRCAGIGVKGFNGQGIPFSLVTSVAEGQMTVGTVFQLYSLQGQPAGLKFCEQVTVIPCCGAIRLVITLGR